jgi:hypothetical protein
MTTTTDRLVASPKTEPTSGNCWELAYANGVEVDTGDHIPHYDSEAKAAAAAKTYKCRLGTPTPRQLDYVCVTIGCSCCGYTYDEDDTTVVHFESLDKAREAVAKWDGWTVAEDGTAKCQPCTAGECDECAGEVARA